MCNIHKIFWQQYKLEKFVYNFKHKICKLRSRLGVKIIMIGMKKKKKQLSIEEIERQKLIEELEKVKRDMNRTYTNLENVVDEEIIDCLIYELNATQIRYKVILNQVRELQSI